MMQLYNWDKPTTIIDTQWGKLAVIEWLEKEEERILKDPTRQAEIRTEHGRVALFVDQVAEDIK